MFKRKNNKRTLSDVGKTNYEFDYEFEKIIYAYLCCAHLKKKQLKKLGEKNKFETYKGWKQYVKDKYARYPNEKLDEFSRYLNQNIRNVKPRREYWSLVVPVILSVVITTMPEVFTEMQKSDYSDVPFMVTVFVIIMVCCIIVYSMANILQMINNMWDENEDENFFVDYKEIIDSIIEERSQEPNNK